MTAFDFPYFANARVMDVKGSGSHQIFARSRFANLRARE